jgi:hypothetical protein
MKIITEQTEKSIHVSKINANDHIVVAIINGDPTILGKGYYEGMDKLTFFILGGDDDSSPITGGNGYDFSHTDDTVEKMIRKVLANENNKVEAFHVTEWRAAMKWLLNNAS